jgi:hypothetical protein
LLLKRLPLANVTVVKGLENKSKPSVRGTLEGIENLILNQLTKVEDFLSDKSGESKVIGKKSLLVLVD